MVKKKYKKLASLLHQEKESQVVNYLIFDSLTRANIHETFAMKYDIWVDIEVDRTMTI